MPATRGQQQRQPRNRSRPASTNPYAYDADAKAQERTDAPVKIGGKIYHRRLKDNVVSRKMWDLAEEQETESTRAAMLRQRAARLDLDEDGAIEEWEDLRNEAKELEQSARDKNYELAALLLVDEEGKPAEVQALKDGLDVLDVARMASLLFSGGEGADPTETPGTPS